MQAGDLALPLCVPPLGRKIRAQSDHGAMPPKHLANSADSAGAAKRIEHHVAGLVERPQRRAGHRRQRPHREAGLGIGQSGRPPVEVDIGSPNAKHLAASPVSQDMILVCRAGVTAGRMSSITAFSKAVPKWRAIPDRSADA